MKRVAPFKTEAELCATFIAAATRPSGRPDIPSKTPREPEWVAYPETGGFDILLVRRVDGFQIGIEAKLRLNDTVLRQALEGQRYDPLAPGPDCIAVLVPAESGRDVLRLIAPFCGITVISCRTDTQPPFYPYLPRNDLGSWAGRDWFENLPVNRVRLPEYVPDVVAGASAPLQLTDWKIAAIKLAVIMDRRGYITRSDFKHVDIDHRRWVGQQWIQVDSARGAWVRGSWWPDFKSQHPINYQQIAADFEKWKPANLLIEEMPNV